MANSIFKYVWIWIFFGEDMCLPHIDILRVYDGKCSQFIVYGNPYDIYIKNVWINSHHFKEN